MMVRVKDTFAVRIERQDKFNAIWKMINFWNIDEVKKSAVRLEK